MPSKATHEVSGHDFLSRQLDLKDLGAFSAKHFCAQFFTRKSQDEAEKVLIAGTATTTPLLSFSMTEWPQPWIFLRILASAFTAYLLLYWVLAIYQDRALAVLPALLIVGSFAVPVAVLVLFFEMNTPRNVSLHLLVKFCLLGGALSFLLTFWLYDEWRILSDAYGASAAGFVEEVAKLLALLILIRQHINKYPHLLNGLLMGAAIGTGFSAFESAGYALRLGLETNSFHALNLNLIVRGLLSPFSHIVWSAIAAGAFWLSYRTHRSFVRSFFSSRFASLFMISLILHFIWNLDIGFGLWGVLMKNLLLGVIAWLIVFRMFGTGLKQLLTQNEF